MSSIPGNTTTAETLAPGASVTSSIDAAGDADWFRLNLSQGLAYGISLVATGGPGIGMPDPDLALYDAFGNLVLSAPNSSSTTNGLSFTAGATGLSFAGVFDSGGDTGAYRITLNAADTIRGDIATASTLGANKTITSAIDVASDRDWHKIQTTEGLAYGIELRAVGTTGLPDGDLVLRDADGNAILNAPNSTGTVNRISWTAGSTTTNFVDVFDGGTDTGGYEVRFVATDTIRGDVETARTLARTATVTSAVDVAGDSDWFRVTLTAGQSYAFDLGATGVAGLPDGDLILRDANGNIVAQSPNSTGSANVLAFTPTVGGLYFIEVYDGGSDTGGYSLRNVGGDGVLASVNTTRSLRDGTATTGTVDCQGDSDWIRMEAEQGVTYTFRLEGDGTATELADVRLVLRDAAGNILASDSGATGTLIFTGTIDGPVFLDVQGRLLENIGGYRLSVVSTAPTVTGTGAADRLTGGDGANTISAFGGNDVIDGGLGDDRLFGAQGADTLLGGDGNDRLYGGSEDDSLSGGSGRDWIDGGAGNDALRGGIGADRFVFGDATGSDSIADFQDGQDRIVITGATTDLNDLALTQVGDDVQVSFGTSSILVANILLADLTAADFLFL